MSKPAPTARPSPPGRGNSQVVRSGTTVPAGADVTTPVTLPSEADPSRLQDSADFEEGLANDDAEKTFEERQLAAVSKNSDKPFNFVIPIAIITAIMIAAAFVVGAKRLRATDEPSI